ncbi:plastocyanin/azurin family copper-binding protein [Kitasatospora sp. NPDC001660]
MATAVGVGTTLGTGYASDLAQQTVGQQTPLAATALVSTNSVNTVQTSSAVKVNIAGFAFSPSSLTVSRGTTVTWTNGDPVMHSVKSDGRGPLHSGPMNPGDSYSFRFDSPGTYSYHCCFHTYMVATVTVK